MKFGIIFDMDGTLWDSAQQVAQAWSGVTKPKLGITVTKEEVCRCMGMPMDKLFQELLPEFDMEKIQPVIKECEQVENAYLAEHGGKLYPKLVETLQILSEQYPLYIVSNCQAGYIEAFLEHYKLSGYFQDHICYGDNELQKGDNIALIMKRNKLEQAVYVGDIQADYEAAIAGGAEFIHAAYGFGTIHADVEAIHEFSELPVVVAKFLHK